MFESRLVMKERVDTILTVIVFITPFILLTLYRPSDLAGICLMLGIVLLTIFNKDFLQNRKVFFSANVIMMIHHAIAIINAYITVTPGAEEDAVRFQRDASMVSTVGDINLLSNGSGFYINFLGLFYKTFGVSHLLGMELSVLAFFLSLVILLKILNITGQTKNQHIILLMYGLLPTVLMITSVTLRESWQMLFFMSIVYCSIKLRKTKRFGWFLALLLSMIGLTFWHNGFLALFPILMFITVWWSFKSKKRSIIVNFFLIVVATVLVMGSMKVISNSPLSSAASALTSGKSLNYIEEYRSNSKLGTGASYVSSISFSGPLGTLLNIPIMFMGYMLAPYPWHIRGPLDIYAFCESWFRFILLLSAIKTWRKSEGLERSVYGFLIILYLLMELLWSMGTSNWGTAMRHHLVAYGVLLSVGGTRFIARIKRFLRLA